MKEWEDIIKDKLEGYESPLPEGSLAEFRSRREASRAATDARREETPVAASFRNDSTAGGTAKKRTPLVWILPTAAAAVLAAALFLRKPNGPDDIINTVQQPSNPVVAVADSVEAAEPTQMDQQAAPAQHVQIFQPAAPRPRLAQAAEGTTPESAAIGQTEPAAQEQEATPSQDGQSDAEAGNAPQNSQQPITTGNLENRGAFSVDFPEIELQKTGQQASYKFNVLATAGGAVGAGLLTTLLTNIDFGMIGSLSEPEGLHDMRQAHADYLKFLVYLEKAGIDTSDPYILDALFALYEGDESVGSTGEDYTDAIKKMGIDPSDLIDLVNTYKDNNKVTNSNPPYGKNPQTDNLLSTTHRMPLKAGLSVRTPVAQKLYLTTGIEYSRYTTVNTYSQSGELKQYEQYLGIPLRLDWTFVSGKRFDLYAGAGVKAEWCLAGSENFSTSLLGVGGVQLNLTDWLGIYVEPELSWKMSIDKPTATTYRSEHPLLFTVGTGLRFTI